MEKGPTSEQLQQFWGNIWAEEVQFNRQAEWLEYCKQNYCRDVTPITYELTNDFFPEILQRMANNKSSGRNRITGY